MQDLTVQCGCGRKMLVEPLRGRGAFRCGCGARVLVTAPLPAPTERAVHCGFRTRTGPCSEPPQERDNGSQDALALCVRHYTYFLDRVLEELLERSGQLTGSEGHWLGSPGSAADRIALRLSGLIDRYKLARVQAPAAEPLVYFGQVGNRIKIGTSTNLKNRLRSLSIARDAILATEPGGHAREAELHARFDDLREEGEWFRAEEPLLGYIAALPK